MKAVPQHSRAATTPDIRIAYVIYSEWRENQSGLTTFIDAIRTLFEQPGFDARLVELPEFVTSDGGAPGGVQAGAPAPAGASIAPRRLEGLRLALGYARTLLRDVRRLWKRRADLKGRIIVTNEFGCEVLPVALRCLRPLATVVAISHTHPSRNERTMHPVRCAVERLCYAAVSDVVFNSAALKSLWGEKLGRRALRGSVIHHGLYESDPDTAAPADYPEPPAGPPVVDCVFVARFVAWKGHRQLLTAWKLARDRSAVPLRLILVGDGPTLPDCLAHAEGLGLCVADSRVGGEGSERNGSAASAEVVFMGNRPGGARYFGPADIGLLLPVEPEAFGLVLLEMMSRARPVIASRLGGIPEIVEDGRTGWLVDPLDASQVAGAICRLADDAGERERMGRAGRERWHRDFRIGRMREEYAAYFGRVAGGRATHAGN